jgi:DNA-binding transcriptional LysR family regulator
MQLHQLEYLVAIAEERSVTRAAARLRIAQPGVSAQIRKLERELGHALLDRSGHHVELTAVGAEVANAARSALAAIADVRHVADELSGLLRGRVRVGAVTSGPFLDLPDVLADFRAAHPQVGITLTAGGSAAALAGLDAGRIDVALTGLVGADPDELEVRTVTEETLVVAAAPDHPLAARESVGVTELAGYDLVAAAEGSAFRVALDQAFAASGVSPRIAFEASDPAIVARLASRGLGPAVLPDSLQAVRTGTLIGIPLTGPVPRARLVVAWRRGRPQSPAARALTGAMIHAVKRKKTVGPPS